MNFGKKWEFAHDNPYFLHGTVHFIRLYLMISFLKQATVDPHVPRGTYGLNSVAIRSHDKIAEKKRLSMGKISDQQIAELISRRILEIIDLTGLTLESLASFVGVSTSTIRSAYRKTGSLSVDSLSKICRPFAIRLADFFDSALALKIDEEHLPDLKEFKKSYFADQELTSPASSFDESNSQSEHHRQQRELIAYIIYRSDYFNSPKTLEAMVADFRKDYQAAFTSERLYALLLKYLGSGILDKKALPRTARRMPANKRPYLYFKKESKKA